MQNHERLECFEILQQELGYRRTAIKLAPDGPTEEQKTRCLLWGDACNRFAGSRIQNADLAAEIGELTRTASEWQRKAGLEKMQGAVRVLGRKVPMLNNIIHHLSRTAQPVAVQNELF